MRNDNRGFTLVELIVSFAIFGILIAAVGGFLVSGSRSYSSIFSNISLQTQSQTAMDAIEDRLMDCAVSAQFDETTHTLTIDDQLKYRLDTDDGIMYCSDDAGATWEPLARYVTQFTVTRPAQSSRSSVELSLSFARGTRSYSETRTVALRNDPATAGIPEEEGTT